MHAHTHTLTGSHTIHLWHAHPLSPLLPLFYAFISGCANPLAKSGTQLPIWPSTAPAGRRWGGGAEERKKWVRGLDGGTDEGE